MNKAFPSYATVLHKISTAGALLESDDHVQAIARQRLRSLNEFCRLHGSQFIFVIVLAGQPGENGVAAAGKAIDVTVLVPVRRELVKPSDLADRFHLNVHGRAMFTKALIENLANSLR